MGADAHARDLCALLLLLLGAGAAGSLDLLLLLLLAFLPPPHSLPMLRLSALAPAMGAVMRPKGFGPPPRLAGT